METISIDILIEKMTSLFPDLSPDAIPLTLLVQGCLPKSHSRADIEKALLSRINMHQRLKEIEDEIIRTKELYFDNLPGSIRS